MKVYRVIPLKKTAHPIVDQIRARARALNFSMTDLDCIASAGHYFRNPHPAARLDVIYRAIEALDGVCVVQVVWR